jgi:hypothetical protein
MDKLIRRLLLVENVGKRLKALSEARGIPKNTEQQMTDESEALSWAFHELHDKLLIDVMILVGDKEFIQKIEGIEQESLETHDELMVCVQFAPDRMIFDNIREFLTRGWNGNRLPEDKLLEYVFCKRYYASCEGNDMSKRAILFDCLVLRTWLEEIGKKTARGILTPWSFGVFRAMRWDEAKRVT